METHSSVPDPATAQAALQDVHNARGRLAERVETPWWYRVALGLTMAGTFVAVGSGDERIALIGVALGCATVPFALAWALNRATGISMDRYRTPVARWYSVGLLALAGVGLGLRFGLGLGWGMALAGLLALVFVLVMEPRVDEAVRAGLRSEP